MAKAITHIDGTAGEVDQIVVRRAQTTDSLFQPRRDHIERDDGHHTGVGEPRQYFARCEDSANDQKRQRPISTHRGRLG